MSTRRSVVAGPGESELSALQPLGLLRLAFHLVHALRDPADVLLREVADPDLARHVEAEVLEQAAKPRLDTFRELPGLVGLTPDAVAAHEVLGDPALLELAVLDERHRHD